MRSAHRPKVARNHDPSPAAPHNAQLRITPEFGPNWLHCRLVKLEHLVEDGATHIALWEPRDR
jgi:hypothetical protein